LDIILILVFDFPPNKQFISGKGCSSFVSIEVEELYQMLQATQRQEQ